MPKLQQKNKIENQKFLNWVKREIQEYERHTLTPFETAEALEEFRRIVILGSPTEVKRGNGIKRIEELTGISKSTISRYLALLDEDREMKEALRIDRSPILKDAQSTKGNKIEYWVFLKQARNAAKLTRIEVSQKIDISTMTLWRWETGKEEPTLSNFEKWIDVFGLKITLGFKNEKENNRSR